MINSYPPISQPSYGSICAHLGNKLGSRIGVSQARIAEIEANPGLVNLDQILQVLSALDANLLIQDKATPPTSNFQSREEFDNLLPDNDNIRERIGQRFQTSSDVFSLLEAIGRDCVGAVQILPDGARPENWQQISAKVQSTDNIAERLRNLSSATPPPSKTTIFSRFHRWRARKNRVHFMARAMVRAARFAPKLEPSAWKQRSSKSHKPCQQIFRRTRGQALPRACGRMRSSSYKKRNI